MAANNASLFPKTTRFTMFPNGYASSIALVLQVYWYLFS